MKLVLIRIQRSKQQQLWCVVLAGDELVAVAEARVSSGGGYRARGEDLVVATCSWRGKGNDDACGSGWFGLWPWRPHGRRREACGHGGRGS